MPFLFARTAARLPVLVAALFIPSLAAAAEVSGHDWQHNYPLSGQPVLSIETADSGLDIRPCGDCKSIRIQVHTDRDLNEYRLDEHQDGDHVFFSLKEKPHMGMHFNWNSDKRTRVTVETPARLELDAKTADGSLNAQGLDGTLQVQSGDGSVLLEDVSGTLHLTSADGNLTVRRAKGALDVRGSDGHVQVDGQFSSVQMRTSDGSLDLTLAQGSQLTAASRIESSDGHVSIRVPQTLAADLDVATSDGRVDCNLPLKMDHYDSHESSGHHLHGQLNAGGVPLSIRTSDGSVSITSL